MWTFREQPPLLSKSPLPTGVGLECKFLHKSRPIFCSQQKSKTTGSRHTGGKQTERRAKKNHKKKGPTKQTQQQEASTKKLTFRHQAHIRPSKPFLWVPPRRQHQVRLGVGREDLKNTGKPRDDGQPNGSFDIWPWVKSQIVPSEHPNPHQKTNNKNGWCTYPKMVPLVWTHSHMAVVKTLFPW